MSDDAKEVPMIEHIARAMWQASNHDLPEYRWGELSSARHYWFMLARVSLERLCRNQPTRCSLAPATGQRTT